MISSTPGATGTLKTSRREYELCAGQPAGRKGSANTRTGGRFDSGREAQGRGSGGYCGDRRDLYWRRGTEAREVRE
eukprot:2215699-Rhodomonas_salina.1